MSDCISLQGSTRCPAFQSSSISVSAASGQYDFLKYVSDRASFDSELASYVQTTFVQEQFEARIGCQGIDLANTSNIYPRYLTSTICSAIVQSSISACNLTAADSKPLCADTCAEFAESEVYIVDDSALCSNPASDAIKLIRSDFVICSSPDSSLSSECVPGSANEPNNCGYGNSTIGLCSYCASGGINSTDTCCYNSDAENRCAGVVLPTITSTMTFTTTPSATPGGNATTVDESHHHGLSGGAIAGIVIGSIAGVALLAGLIFLAIVALRRRRPGSANGSIFNQPSPARKGPQMTHTAASSSHGSQQFGVLPGGRIARMSALEGPDDADDAPSPPGRGMSAGAAAAGGVAGYAMGAASRRRMDDHSSSDGYNDSPDSENRTGILRPPPATMRRNGSLSSGSVLAIEDPQSPSSAGMSSPQAIASQQSEQLPFFKDYYSQDDIHPGDRVAVLWAYQPRAADEFALERGDMLKVVGIWDDGWATGVMMDERADEWEARRQAQRDSGVSNTSGRGRDISPAVSGDIKAFPLVCVCLPEHWRKTIEGDSSTETASSAQPGMHGL